MDTKNDHYTFIVLAKHRADSYRNHVRTNIYIYIQTQIHISREWVSQRIQTKHLTIRKIIENE